MAAGEQAGEGALRFILRRARPHRLLLVTALLASAFSAAFALAPMLVIHGLAREVLSQQPDASTAMLLALAGLAAILAHLLLSGTAAILGHKIAFAIQRQLRHDMLGKLERMPVGSLEGKAGGIKKTTLADVDRLEGLLAHVLPDMAAGLTGPIVGAVILGFVDWRIMLAALAMLPFAWLAQMWTWSGRAALFEEWNRTEALANAAMLSYVRGIATLKAFNRQASTLENVTLAVNALRDLAVTVTRRSRYPYSLFNSTLSVNLLIVLPVALILYDAGTIDRAELVLAAILGASLTAPLNKVVFAAMIMARASVGIERIRSILPAPEIADHGGAILGPGNAIRFEKVGFAYPDGKPVLADIDLDVPEGKLTAVVGPSGAGKTTLARLLPRFDDCTSGRILVDGTDIRDVSLAELRSRIGVVFQDTVLFHGTVGENIAMASPYASLEQMVKAVADARLEGVGGVKNPLSLSVNDRGVGLSGGERQRVAIARTMLKDAPILILDEATAFLDAENEARVHAALQAVGEGRTMLVIAHRLATVRHADRIVVLDQGRIEAVGKHEELLSASPTYARLWNAQQSATGWKLGRGAGLAA